MGLDMYLERHTYVQNWDHHPPEQRWEITATRGGEPVAFTNITSIVEQVAYWRKANAIHKWFVDTLANGVDECQPIDVAEENLRDLVALCRRVLDGIELRNTLVKRGERSSEGAVSWKPIMEPGQAIVDPAEAEQLLPTTSGFFFGSTDYDEGYVMDLRDTIEQIEKALAMPVISGGTYVTHLPDGSTQERVWNMSTYIYRASW